MTLLSHVRPHLPVAEDLPAVEWLHRPAVAGGERPLEGADLLVREVDRVGEHDKSDVLGERRHCQ